MSLEKKLQKVREQAYKEGIEDSHSFLLKAILETKGIGPILKVRIMETASEIAKQKLRGE